MHKSEDAFDRDGLLLDASNCVAGPGFRSAPVSARRQLHISVGRCAHVLKLMVAVTKADSASGAVQA